MSLPPAADQSPTLRVVLSASLLPALEPALAGGDLPAGIGVEDLAQWRDSLAPVGPPGADGAGLALVGPPVLCLCLDPGDAAKVAADAALTAALRAGEVPVHPADPETVLAVVMRAALTRAQATTGAAADLRAALAEVRGHHMQMQTDHAELESWVYEALAPKYKLARSWAVTDRTVTLGSDPIVQPLPVSVRGFLAVDVHIADGAATAGALEMTVGRMAGPDVTAPVSVPVAAGQAGWVRLVLPSAPGGAPQDGDLRLRFVPAEGPADGASAGVVLSLGPESPFADLNLTAAGQMAVAPLALRVYQTLPRQPAPPMQAPGVPLPADGVTRLVRPGDLGPPAMLPFFAAKVRRALRSYPDLALVEYWQDQDAVFVHPSVHRPVVAVLPGLEADALIQLSAVVQLSRHDTLPVAFAVGVAPAGSVTSGEAAMAHLGGWVHVMPSEWGEAWVEPPKTLSGKVDLLLATAMPGMPFNRNADALFHAFRVTSAVGTP